MRDKIKLISTEGTGHFYTTTKNKKTMPGKMEIKKFDKRAYLPTFHLTRFRCHLALPVFIAVSTLFDLFQSITIVVLLEDFYFQSNTHGDYYECEIQNGFAVHQHTFNQWLLQSRRLDSNS